MTALWVRFAWNDITFTWRCEAVPLSLCSPSSSSSSSSFFFTDRPHRNTENNLTCSAMGLSSQGFQWERPVSERGIEINNWRLFVKFSYVDEYIRSIHHSEVITIIKPDVFIFCHSHRRIPRIVKCACVAQYHPLVGLCLVVGTLTSKQLNSQSFIISPHMDRGNLFTLIWKH